MFFSPFLFEARRAISEGRSQREEKKGEEEDAKLGHCSQFKHHQREARAPEEVPNSHFMLAGWKKLKLCAAVVPMKSSIFGVISGPCLLQRQSEAFQHNNMEGFRGTKHGAGVQTSSGCLPQCPNHDTIKVHQSEPRHRQLNMLFFGLIYVADNCRVGICRTAGV